MKVATFQVMDGDTIVDSYEKWFDSDEDVYEHLREQNEHPFLSVNLVWMCQKCQDDFFSEDEDRLAKLEREVSILKEQWSRRQRKRKVVSFWGHHDGEWTDILHCAKCKKVKGAQ